MKSEIRTKWIIVLIITIFLIGSISAVTYLSSNGIFDAEISYVNNQKLPHSIILNVDSQVEEILELDIEVIYERENLVVGSKKIDCNGQCEVKVELKKSFFDSNKVIIRTKYNGKYYQKKLQFNLEETKKNNTLILPKVFEYSGKESLEITGTLFLEKENKVIFDITPREVPEAKVRFEKNCTMECDFSIPLTSNIIYGEYILRAYLPDDALSSTFTIFKEKEVQNSTLNKEKNKRIFPVDSQRETIVYDLFGNPTLGESLGSLDSTYSSVGRVGDERVEVPGKIQLTSFNPNSKNKRYLDSIQTISSREEIENVTTQVVEEIPGIARLAQQVSPTYNNPSTILAQTQRIYTQRGRGAVEFSNESIDEKNKLIPGIYKKEVIKTYSDGTEIKEEGYFAYGLISINTIKPLYTRGEVTEMLIVVLDKWGYLVSDAPIILEVTKPSGDIIQLTTQDGDIYETSKSGVYSTSLLSDELGEYSLYAQVELSSMVVDIESFYNVVEDYEFEIIREVPATIDPWLGPFTNTFSVEPLQGYSGEYSFTEVFSSDFTEIDTNADLINREGGLTYLTWNNLEGDSTLRYSAQVPLVTPYLYYLGKSYVEYDSQKFYENRSWQFAIDPEAQACDFESPCICGGACSGAGEPGDGTIDTCGDGNTDYEFVNDIRVTSLDGDYFGTGDTIEICVDFDCDNSGNGDLVTIGYKDGSGGWVNGDVVQEWRCDVANTVTECTTTTLSSYVGTHHVRGKIVWQFGSRPTNDICDEPIYYDHDDVSFEVLDKVAASQLSWNLDNGTTIGDGLNVVRGSNITAFALWNKPIQSAQLEHEGTGSPVNYSITNIFGNQTNYTMDTGDLSSFTSIGTVNVNSIYSQDLYFNLTGSSTPVRIFDLYGTLSINQSILDPYVMFNGTTTSMSCQVTDENVPVQYSGVTVSFYHNETGLLGTDTTNSTGWASTSFVENNVGEYDITCVVEEDLPSFYLASDTLNVSSQNLIVRENGTDITPPVISGVSSNPSLFSIGGLTSLRANVTDDINLVLVQVNVTLPDSTSFLYNMTNIGGDTFEFNFSQTIQDGRYNYYVYALDNSSNPTQSSTRSFDVSGIRTFIGIETTKDIYKIGETINLTSFTRTTQTDTSTYSEQGDTGNIFYSFDSSDEGWTSSGTNNEWERGVNSNGFVNQCDSSNCWGTDLDLNYNSNSNQVLSSPLLNMSGREDIVVTFWRMLEIDNGITNDRAFFRGNDGTTTYTYFQDTVSASDPFTLSAGTSTYFTTELDNQESAQYSFTLTSNGGTNYEGWGIDSFNISFTPRVDWDKSWVNYNSAFGSSVNKTAAIRILINITDYSASGSDSLGTNSPDLEIQVFDGTSYSGAYSCGLDSTDTFPLECEIVIKNTPLYLDAWNTPSNRMIRVRAVDLDTNDFINWTDVRREHITPSIIENHGAAQVSSFLLEQFKNSTGSVVETLYNNSITLNPGEARQLANFWTYSVPEDFTLGDYTAYVALTDSSGNVLQNEDDFTFINDSFPFSVQSLIINVLNPTQSSIQLENFDLNLSLDTTFFASGGWCGYSLNGAANVTMVQQSPTLFDDSLTRKDGNYSIIFHCNDTDGYMVRSPLIDFNVSQDPRISFVPPTDSDNQYVNRSWTQINVTINDTANTSAYLDFNNDLLLYWNSQNATGTTIYDYSSYSREGTLENSVTRVDSNHRGRSIDYAGGNNDRITRSAAFLEGLDEVTFSVWVNSDVTTTDRGIFNAYPLDGTDTFGLRYDAAGFEGGGSDLIKAGLRTTTGNSAIESTSFTQATGWQHLVLTWKQGEEPELYINGVRDTLSYSSGILDGVLDPDTTLYLGDGAKDENWQGELDEFMIWERKLSPEEIAALYDSNNNNLQTNISGLRNNNYTYFACAVDEIGNQNCTETRTININKTLGTIQILNPINNSKYTITDSIDFNATVSLPQNWMGIEYNNNGTIYNLTSGDFFNWTTTLANFSVGGYSVTFYGNDSLNNQINQSVFFRIITDKYVRISKTIQSTGTNMYEVNTTIENLGRWTNYSYHDIVDSLFSVSSYLEPPLADIPISGVYSGRLLIWEDIINTSESKNYSYNISASGDFRTRNLFIVGIE